MLGRWGHVTEEPHGDGDKYPPSNGGSSQTGVTKYPNCSLKLLSPLTNICFVLFVWNNHTFAFRAFPRLSMYIFQPNKITILSHQSVETFQQVEIFTVIVYTVAVIPIQTLLGTLYDLISAGNGSITFATYVLTHANMYMPNTVMGPTGKRPCHYCIADWSIAW